MPARINEILLKILPLTIFFIGVSGFVLLYHNFYQPFGSLNWLSSIFFYVSLFCILIGGLFTTFRIFNLPREIRYKILLGILSVYFVLVLSEFFLRVAGVNKAYVENRNGKYVSSYISHDNNVNRTYWPGTTTYLQSPEYRYSRHHNNLGFSDTDFFGKGDTNEILVQTYGDSFTEGDGAPMDSSYPAVLRDLLKRDGQSQITVQNFGICGNDPGFYWKQFKDIGSKLHPDIVVITYDCGDLTTDFLTRGGLERFKNGYYKGFDGPWWEWLYGVSYVYRLFAVSLFDVQHRTFFLTEDQRTKRLKDLEPKWNQTFMAIAEIARKNNTKVLLVKKPEHREVDLNKYSYDYSFFEKMADTISCFRRFDLLPYYRDSIHIDSSNSAKYWWPKDGHNQGAGYEVMAGGVYEGLRKNYPEIFVTSLR